MDYETDFIDNIVLSVKIGNSKGDIGYSSSMKSGGKGPEAFTITNDNTIYIVDNVNKRVNIYRNGNFIYDIDIPYIVYIRSIVVSQNSIFLMDYDDGKIFIVNMEGNLVEIIELPKNMVNYRMIKLYVRDDGSVWLYYDNSLNTNNGFDNYSYLINDISNEKDTYLEGYSKNDTNLYTTTHNRDVATIYSTNSLSRSIKLETNEIVGSLQILDIDKNNYLYLELFEQIDTSVVCGEYTVRKYLDNKCLGVASIDLEGYHFMPNNVLNLSESGDLYQIKCLTDEINIIKKTFVSVDDFVSTIQKTKDKYNDCKSFENPILNAVNVPNTKLETMANAQECCLMSWTYTNDNAKNPNISNVGIPGYLKNVSKPSSQTGIPYCWGGFDGLDTRSSTSWENFDDAISKGAFAGNTNTKTSGWQWNTAGFDCSGFVSSVAGFSSKLSTTNLASSTYTKAINESDMLIYDMFVKSGSHVMYYVGDSSNGVKTREATTTGDEKTKLYTRSKTFLSDYSTRRFNGW